MRNRTRGQADLPKTFLFRFNTKDSTGVVLSENMATCIMPWVEAEGWVDFEVALNDDFFLWKGQFFVGKFSSECPFFAGGIIV